MSGILKRIDFNAICRLRVEGQFRGYIWSRGLEYGIGAMTITANQRHSYIREEVKGP